VISCILFSTWWSLTMLSSLLAGIVMGLTAGFSPGPLSTLVITQTLRHGLKEGVKVAVAPLMTDLPIIAASLLLLSRVAHHLRYYRSARTQPQTLSNGFRECHLIPSIQSNRSHLLSSASVYQACRGIATSLHQRLLMRQRGERDEPALGLFAARIGS